ncbi:MAG: hypothetical protein LC109_09070 [Bacteroidia bacterium]|nr:hypothetical protein [Bacteroidia bacterium]MCO5254680.1 hypothetical protein [Bacteroidota bacterium]MCZ2130404.1 hypothetical protein [Bacteroidia bacterium]
MKKVFYLYYGFIFCFALVGLSSCQSAASCGNEVVVVKAPNSGRGNTTSCGNQVHKARKKNRLNKKDRGLFGKEGNPYSSRKIRGTGGKF